MRQLIQKLLNKFLEALRFVDGNKTLIGISFLYLDDKLDFGNSWYVEIVRVGFYLWTGLGVMDKGIKYGKNKGYISEGTMLHKSDNLFRNRRR